MHLFGIRAHGDVPLPVLNFTIASTVTNWNLIAQIGFTPSYPVNVTITVNAGVTVRSTTTGTPAMDLRGLVAGSTVSLINNGTIHGRGGVGGPGDNGSGPTAGFTGGHAIEGPGSGVSFSVTNGAGEIFGGGGGGGGGGRSNELVETSPGEFIPARAGGGGGGGGAGGGAGGAGGSSLGPGATDGAAGTAGTNGSSGVPGTGGDRGTVPAACNGGAGATGGEFGAAGNTGASGANGTTNVAGAAGGSPGKAIDLNGGSITWVSGNTAARVKGAVS